MRVRPMHAGSAANCNNLVGVFRSADRPDNLGACGAPKTNNAAEMRTKEESVGKLRGSHVPQPLASEDEVFRLVVVSLPHNCIFEIGSQFPLFFQIGLGLLSPLFTDHTLVHLPI